jgi:hypothetical protein
MSYSQDDFYSDDPIEGTSTPVKKKFQVFVAFLLFIFAGGSFLQTTLAANISLNPGGQVEFGQGISATVACSGATNLIVTPNSTFVNASGAGAHYFSSVTVSNIPSSCNGKDFTINAYGNTDNSALAIFNSTSKSAVVYSNAGTFELGTGTLTGTSITSGSGTFTITFTNPVATSGSVFKVTLQSGGHVPLVYSVGERGPGGGIVFYVSANYFTSTGSTCSSSCKYLEYAPSTWQSGSVADDLTYQWSNNSSNATGQDISTSTSEGFDAREKTNWKIGQGFNNTSLMQVGGATSAARNAALAFAGSNGSAGQWFIPSTNELNELCKYAFGQNTGNPKVACSYSGSTFKNTAFTGGDLGGFVANFYWASTEQSAGVTMITYFANPVFQDIGNKYQYAQIRPIRAF